MIWVTDHKGNCTYLSPEWHDLTGQKLDEALGAGWTEAIHPDDREAIVSGFTQACARQVEFMLRYRLRRADGAYIWVLDAASPSFTPLTHDFVGFLGLISFDLAPCLPPFITSVRSGSGPAWTGLQTRSG